jgi:hypothetical protein
VSWLIILVLAFGIGAASLLFREFRKRDLDRWIVPYVLQTLRRRAPGRGETFHLFLCIADHFEPAHQGASPSQAMERVRRWVEDYPRLFERFRDADGRPPRHTFFYPMEQYRHDHLDALAVLCRQGYGEVEIHLHHDRDTSEGLRERLISYKELLADRHGLLSRVKATGEVAYGFIHGDWALDNSRPDGRRCGVNDEIDILRETGCYADFTMPSAPDPTQTRTINSIYYALDDPSRPKSHEVGVAAEVGVQPPGGLMLIQGPLVLDWARRKWGVCPKIENGCIQSSQPASIERLPAWLRAGVRVKGRPDWYFVKLHSHGAPEWNARGLLGEPMVRFHQDLERAARERPGLRLHYVTCREMYNLVRAAEDGWAGSIDEARDHALVQGGLRNGGALPRSEAPQVGVPLAQEEEVR